MPDDPTPEDRMELREAFDAASSILHNVSDQTPRTQDEDMTQDPIERCLHPVCSAGCACHERGWQNKWECAVEMAARAEAKLDRMTAALARIEAIYCDGDDTHDDWRAMGEIARAALNEPNSHSTTSVAE